MSRENLIARNIFVGGMNQDTLSSLTDSKNYWMARNAIHSTRESKGFGLTNEGSTEKMSDVGSDVVGTAYCEERDWTFVFRADDSIWYYNHGNKGYNKIMSASEFGCTWNFQTCEWIGNNTEFYTVDPCNELHVRFSANWEYYKVNVDQMLDSERKAGLIKELACDTKCGHGDNCEYFKVFKQGCAPKISPKTFQNGGNGGTLLAGAYTFFARLIHTDGGDTNWFHQSQPAFVGSEHNRAGEETNSYIEISLSGLDCKYASIELAVVENIGGIITAKTLNTFHYNNDHFTYRYTGTDGIPIDIKELLTKDSTYLRGKHLHQKDGHMLYYGVLSRKNIHWQPYVNQVKTQYKVYKILYEDVKKYNIRSFMRDETYAFGIVPNFIDGTHGPSFHIPATPITGGGLPGLQLSTSLEDIVDEPNSNAGTIQSQFMDSTPNVSITYNAKKTYGAQDTLSLNVIGNTNDTNLISGLQASLNQGYKTVVYITDHQGKTVDFDAEEIISSTPASMKLAGVTTKEGSGDVLNATVVKDVTQSSRCSVPNTSGCGTGGISPNSGGTVKSPAPGSSKLGSGPDQTDVTIGITTPQEVERVREAIRGEKSVSNPENDHLDDKIESLLLMMDTDMSDHGCPEVECEGCATAGDRCVADMDDVEGTITAFGDLVAAYTEDELDPTYDSTTIYGAAQKIMSAIKKRERKKRKEKAYNIQKTVDYNFEGDDITSEEDTPNFSGPLFNVNGINETEVDIQEISSGNTEPDFEKDILYPCTTDCNGNFIYGSLAGTPVAHHRFPDSNKEPHFESNAIGVPYGTFYPDASETGDLYINIMGVEFSNIQFPPEAQLPLPLCPHNPYTITMVKRTDSNRKVIIKGLATGTFKITNDGKDYDQQRYGVNSLEEVSFYHNENDSRLSNQGSGTTHALYSLDGLTIQPSLHADIVKEELRLSGVGERYGLYAKGEDPEDAIKGIRVDALGARQSINLHRHQGSDELKLTEHELIFKKYVKGDDSISPGSNGTVPLMNRSQQACIWFGSELAQLTDESFTGDVLDHNVPIPHAEAQYVQFRREMDNQYGALENLNYIPLMQAGKNHSDSIEGPVGDIYIGPFSFVKTGFVSDRVGKCTEDGKFDIPAQVDTKNEKRCICDGPEDIIHAQNGAWVWTTLPEEGDAADPKNWAGTHTVNLSQTLTHALAVGTPATSEYYFPGTTTTNITYVGEFETCPWLREKSDFLPKQWYPEIKASDFKFDSGVSVDGSVSGWTDGFLNQFHRRLEQPSLWQRIVKTIIRTSLNVIFPMMGVDNVFDIAGGADFIGNMAEFPFLLVMWYLMLQVLFTNDTLDKLLGIPICKDDVAGGFKEGYNRGLFFNPTGYNLDYSTMADLYTYDGMSDPYHTCDCQITGETTNAIYVSDRQILDSSYDSYSHVRPHAKIEISGSYGKLTNLFNVGGELYAHTTDAIVPIPRNRAAVASNQGDIFIGGQGFLLQPWGSYTEGIPEGYSGLKSHNEHADTQYGYMFVDREADIVYRFRGAGKLEAISSKGMFNFFKEKLNFCEITDCIDERVPNTAFYSLGVDPRFNRFLITKNEANPEHSFTMSYDFEREMWISFHDYMPRSYIWDRREMYSLADGAIWRHNSDCNFQTFYGKFYPHEIQFTSIGQDVSTFVWESMILNTEAEVCSGCTWLEDVDRTFNKMAFRNSTQGTGTIAIQWISDDRGAFENMQELAKDSVFIRANKKRRVWRINNIHDHRKEDCLELPLTTCQSCEPYESVNEAVFDCRVLDKQNFRNKVIADKYCTYRLTYDYDAITKINTLYVNTYGKVNPI